jgi:hypothetical protein
MPFITTILLNEKIGFQLHTHLSFQNFYFDKGR